MSDSPAAVLFDENGNPVAVEIDGSIYRLAVDAKITSTVLPPDAATDTTASGILNAIQTEDFATETTLSDFKMVFDTTDFSTETTLSGLKDLIELEDFAQETTLQTLLTEAEFENRIPTNGQKDNANSLPINISSDQTVVEGVTASGVQGTIIHGRDDALIARVPTVSLDSADSKFRMAVDGKVQVTVADPPTTATRKLIYADTPFVVPGNQERDTDELITNGKRFYIQQLVVGAEGDPTESGSLIHIIFVDNVGTEHIVWYVFVHGETYPITLPNIDVARDGTFLDGDGTSKIRIRRERMGGGNQAIDCTLIGYEDTP